MEPSSLSDSPGAQGQVGGSAGPPGSRGYAGTPGWASASGRRRSGVPGAAGESCGGRRGPRVAGAGSGRPVDTGGGCTWRLARGKTTGEADSRATNSRPACAFDSPTICISSTRLALRTARAPPLAAYSGRALCKRAVTPPRIPGLAQINSRAAVAPPTREREVRGHLPRGAPQDLRPGCGSHGRGGHLSQRPGLRAWVRFQRGA